MIGTPTFPVIAWNVCPDKVIKRFLGAPGICDSVQKLVTLFVTHTMDMVPGLEDSLIMFHEEGSNFPSTGLTCIPLKVTLSALFVPPIVKVSVMVFAVIDNDPAVIFLLDVYDHPPTPGLNCRLVGAVKINVTLVPTAKSLFAPSAMVILLKVVRTPLYAELIALSAEIFVPLFAAVTTTVK